MLAAESGALVYAKVFAIFTFGPLHKQPMLYVKWYNAIKSR